VTTTVTLPYTCTVWAKAGTSTTAQVELTTNGTGATTDTAALTLTASWQRFSVTKSAGGGTSPTTVTATLKDTGAAATTILLWGAQLEQSATPGVYVRTTTSALAASQGAVTDGVATGTTNGTVTSVSVTTANGVSGTVATATTTPAISLTLGAITPTTVNGLTLASQATGFTIAGGTTSKTLTLGGDATLSGTNTGDQTITLTGDVTGSGTGSFATTIANNAVTDAKVVDALTINTSIAGTFSATANPGLTVGNGTTGYLKIGGSTISDAAGNLTFSSDTAIVSLASGNSLSLPSFLNFIGTLTPAIAPAGQGRIYYNSTKNAFRVSENNTSDVKLGLFIPPPGFGAAQNPLQTGGGAPPASANLFDNNLGYRFTPNTDGRITHLGCYRNDANAKIVRLYRVSDGVELANASVTCNSAWAYTALGGPVSVTAGASYVVAVRSGADAWMDKVISTPITTGNVTINECRVGSASDLLPTGIETSLMYGWADVKFEPGAEGTGQNYLPKLDSSSRLVVSNITDDGTTVTVSGALTYAGTARPKRTLVLTAAGGLQKPSAAPTRTTTDGTNFTYVALDYPDSSTTSASWLFAVPDSFDASTTTVDVTLNWLASTTGNVRWEVAIDGKTTTQAFDSALQTAVAANYAANGTANQLTQSAVGAVTSGWAGGKVAVVRINRIGADAGDSLAAAARLISVKLEWTASKESD